MSEHQTVTHVGLAGELQAAFETAVAVGQGWVQITYRPDGPGYSFAHVRHAPATVRAPAPRATLDGNRGDVLAARIGTMLGANTPTLDEALDALVAALGVAHPDARDAKITMNRMTADGEWYVRLDLDGPTEDVGP